MRSVRVRVPAHCARRRAARQPGVRRPRSRAPYQLAKAVYGQVRLRGAARLRQTARSLRVLGVYLCGSDLAHCPCTEALARDPQQARVDRVVTGALDGAGF
ncbi:hypothetical protein K7G98_00390 [Saccharothrix sp. MB29]|nr:hypothetical protein [Saccharothrix sp. MB29]